MFGFIKKAFKSVTHAAKSLTTVIKPVAAGVAIIYPPAAPIAAGVFVADKALNAVNVKPGTKRFHAAVRIVAKTQGVSPKAAAVTLQERYKAGQRTIANTVQLAASGDVHAARGLTLVTKRAAARREAARWKLKRGRVARVA